MGRARGSHCGHTGDARRAAAWCLADTPAPELPGQIGQLPLALGDQTLLGGGMGCEPL